MSAYRPVTSAWTALLLTACAPVYRPPAPFVPLLEEPGDVNLAAQLGVGGAQLDGAVAVSDAMAVRGGAQAGGWALDGHYGVGRLGVGLYSGNDRGTRWAVWLDAGGGLTRYTGNFQVPNPNGAVTTTTTTTTDGDVTTTTTERVWIREERTYSGPLLLGAVRPQLGHEGKVLSPSLVLGLGYHTLFHDAQSASSGTSVGLTFEPTGVLRLGGGEASIAAAQAWLGLVAPIIASGDENIPLPVNAGLGLTVDLDRRN